MWDSYLSLHKKGVVLMKHFIIGLFILQIGLLALLLSGPVPGFLALSDLFSVMRNSHLAIGDNFPSLYLYDQNSNINFISPSKPAETIIIASCECESEVASDWATAALSQGDLVYLIMIDTPPDKLYAWRGYVPTSTHIYTYRGNSLFTLLDIKPNTLPIRVKLTQDGLISSIVRR